MFQTSKLALLMKNRPTVDMKTSGMNFRIDVHSCTVPIALTPTRLIAAGSHSPISARTIENSLFWPVLTNSSTYSTQPTTIAALPDQAVIQ